MHDEMETGVNETEIAEQSTDVTETTEPSTEEQAPETETAEIAEPQSEEDNARFAAARREAEARMRAVQQSQAQLDSEFANLFAGYTNPVTGEPIRTAQDYLQAMQVQMRETQNQQLREAGLDPELIDKAISQSPVIRQAQQVIQQHNNESARQMLQEDIQKVIEFDPTVNSEQDVLTQPNIQEVIQYVQNTGLRFADAYKLVNFTRLQSIQTDAAKQAAINQARSKGHLSTGPNANGESEGVDIPANELAQWKSWFPDKSAKELRALYNRAKGD